MTRGDYIFIESSLNFYEIEKVFKSAETLRQIIKQDKIIELFIYESLCPDSNTPLSVDKAIKYLKQGVKVYGYIQGTKIPDFGFSKHYVI